MIALKTKPPICDFCARVYFVNRRRLLLIDYPAGYHNAAGGLSFADGHAEIHKWLSKNTYTPPNPITSHSGTDVGLDMRWLSSVTTVPK